MTAKYKWKHNAIGYLKIKESFQIVQLEKNAQCIFLDYEIIFFFFIRKFTLRTLGLFSRIVAVEYNFFLNETSFLF